VTNQVNSIDQKITQLDNTVKALEPKVKETNMEKATGYLSTKQICATDATGSRSVALGNGTSAEGYVSTATGGDTTAAGDYSFTEGVGTRAEGLASHAQGNGSKAIGAHSAAFGNQIIASHTNQFAMGTFNKDEANVLLEVGNGTGEEKWKQVTSYQGYGEYRVVKYEILGDFNNGEGTGQRFEVLYRYSNLSEEDFYQITVP
jgi:hypothetical protein